MSTATKTAVTVLLDNKRVRLGNRDVIGVGGEATVFRHNGRAVKIYQAPTAARAKKLHALIGLSFPAEVIAPQRLALDAASGQAIGFAMSLLDPDFTELRQLSMRNYRAMSGLTAREVTALFLAGWRTLSAIHAAGAVVGDLNDLNLMFHRTQPKGLIYIDVDSFQFGPYPCMVGTEAFLDPSLYGVNLAAAPVFRPEYDWYSFAVMWFKSLLLVHPYGGVHPSLNTLTARATARISALHPDVKYPRIGYHPDLLSDALAAEFEAWFGSGKRAVFPESALQMYLAGLRTCSQCGAAYPHERGHCPLCAAAAPTPPTPKDAGTVAGCRTLLQAGGPIVAWQVSGDVLRLIAHEHGKAVYYRLRGKNGYAERIALFDALPDAQYAFLEDVLIIAPSPAGEDLMAVDCSSGKPVGLLKTSTNRFGAGAPVFGANGRSLYRLAGGYLLRGHFEGSNLLESPIMAAAEDQTWLRVAPDAEKVFGFFRTFDAYSHFLLTESSRQEVLLAALENGEILLEADVRFAPHSALIARRTALNGVERVRLDEIDHKGRTLHSRIATTPEDYEPLDAHAYATGMILRATDNGILQERLDGRAGKLFSQTEPFVGQGDAVTAFGDGLLVRRADRVLLLTV